MENSGTGFSKSTRGLIFEQVFDNVRDTGCVTWGGMYRSMRTEEPIDSVVLNTVTYNLFQVLEHTFHHDMLQPMINDLGWGWR